MEKDSHVEQTNNLKYYIEDYWDIVVGILAWKSTEEGQTNYFEGLSHLMFFICYAIIAAYY